MAMTSAAAQSVTTRAEQLELAREVLLAESRAIGELAERLDGAFCDAVTLLERCRGQVVVSGMGKAGLIGAKLAATLASTGTRSLFLHPAEAFHGDLGRVGSDDVLLMLSFSGATDEVVRLMPHVRGLGARIIAITGRPESPLAQAADVVLDLGPLREACPLGLAPSTSTTAMLALGDALALVTSQRRQFGAADFARFHPGGSLGLRLAKVDDSMRPRIDCRVASQSQSVREVFVQLSRPGRRTGAIMLVNDADHLTGLFTDSDLARLLERNRDADLDAPIEQVMTHSPRTVTLGTPLSEAIEMMAERKLSELPVIDHEGHPQGIIDITDVVGLLPREPAPSAAMIEPAGDSEAAVGDPSDDSPATLPFQRPRRP